METNGEKLTRQSLIQQNTSKRKQFNAEFIYHCLIDEVCEIITKRGRKLILENNYKYVLGQIALWYANDKRFKGDLLKGIMLRGNVGTGKTVIVQALMNVMLNVENLLAAFICAVDLQELYLNNDKEEISVLKERKYTIIDDVGVEMTEAKNYGNTREPFNDVFDFRYRHNKITIVTTNLKPSEIEEKYGTRIIDRFRECMNDLVLDGVSFRK